MNSEKFDQVKGRVKEAVGSLIGHEDLKAQGRAEQRSAETKRNVGKVSGEAKSVVDEVADKATVAVDKTKDALHQE